MNNFSRFLKAGFIGVVCLFAASCKTTFNAIPNSSEIQKTNIYTEYLNIADIYTSLEKFDKAETYYKKSLHDKSIYWEAYYKLGKVYVYEKKWSDAEKVFDNLYSRDKNNASLKESLAYIKMKSGNISESKAIYSELLKDFPNNQEFYENYLSILIYEGDYNQLSDSFSDYKEKFPESKNITSIQKLIEELKPAPAEGEAEEQLPEEQQ